MRRGKTSRASVGSARAGQNQPVARSLDSAVDFRLSLGSKASERNPAPRLSRPHHRHRRCPRPACSQGLRSLLSWPTPSLSSHAATDRRALVAARATCSTQGRCFSTCPRRATSRVLRTARLRLTVEAQLVEGAARDSCVRADAPRVRTPDPGAIQPQSGAALLSPATTLASLSGALGR